MAKSSVTKVGTGASAGTEKPAKVKKEKVVRKDFDVATSGVALDDAGRMSAVPTTFDAKLHKPLNRKQFTTKAVFFDFRVSQVDRQIAQLQARRQDLIERKTGKESNARKVAKVQKLRNQLKELEALLQSEGVNL